MLYANIILLILYSYACNIMYEYKYFDGENHPA